MDDTSRQRLVMLSCRLESSQRPFHHHPLILAFQDGHLPSREAQILTYPELSSPVKSKALSQRAGSWCHRAFRKLFVGLRCPGIHKHWTLHLGGDWGVKPSPITVVLDLGDSCKANLRRWGGWGYTDVQSLHKAPIAGITNLSGDPGRADSWPLKHFCFAVLALGIFPTQIIEP